MQSASSVELRITGGGTRDKLSSYSPEQKSSPRNERGVEWEKQRLLTSRLLMRVSPVATTCRSEKSRGSSPNNHVPPLAKLQPQQVRTGFGVAVDESSGSPSAKSRDQSFCDFNTRLWQRQETPESAWPLLPALTIA